VVVRFIEHAGVRSCYDEGKRTAETLTMDYHRGANLEVRARPKDGRFIQSFTVHLKITTTARV
jgi:hypothetical protein